MPKAHVIESKEPEVVRRTQRKHKKTDRKTQVVGESCGEMGV